MHRSAPWAASASAVRDGGGWVRRDARDGVNRRLDELLDYAEGGGGGRQVR
jgi:hypothetical protein